MPGTGAQRANEKKILVVEDESAIALMLEESLTRIGYRVAGVACRGEDAVRLARETNPDVVLMDINLNGTMDGISAAEEILSSLDIPVIYLTAYTDEETIMRAAKTDSSSYLVKPINMRELFANIELAIHRKIRDSKANAVPPATAPVCSCGEELICTFSHSGEGMIPIGWVCPACHYFQSNAP